MKQLLASDVTFSVRYEPELLTVTGNVLASGDEAADKEAEQDIIDRLNREDMYAWCCVVVEAHWKSFSGQTTLGCVSCESPEDFEENHGYLEQMKIDALAELNKNIKAIAEDLKELM
jgi:hypothetical protein